MLGTIAHLSESLRHVSVDIVAADLHPTLRRRLLGNDDLHCRSLTGAVVAQQTHNFTWFHCQREISHGDLPVILALRTAG